MLSHLILQNTQEVGKCRYYSHCFQTGRGGEKRSHKDKRRQQHYGQASRLQKPSSVTWGQLLHFHKPQLPNLKNGWMVVPESSGSRENSVGWHMSGIYPATWNVGTPEGMLPVLTFAQGHSGNTYRKDKKTNTTALRLLGQWPFYML